MPTTTVMATRKTRRWRALYAVFESVGEKEISFYRGVLTGPPDALDRVRVRSGVERTKTSPFAYADRHGGTAHLPFAEALELAKAFCGAEPTTVLVGVEATEREWSMKASQPGGELSPHAPRETAMSTLSHESATQSVLGPAIPVGAQHLAALAAFDCAAKPVSLAVKARLLQGVDRVPHQAFEPLDRTSA